MSSLYLTDLVMPSADLGQPNPLPDIQSAGDTHTAISIDEESVTAEESRYMGWGRVSSILPYLIQDGYNRDKKPHAWQAVILENDYLKATFLPQLGGRLWSLYDQENRRELLHKNPVFQPCNLALRNAWISGGVEWNIGLIGHTPFTVDPVFAEKLVLNDGTPVLRLYQYERIRRLVYRIEAILPEQSRQLLIRVRIDNTSDQDTAVYWWSNMAVDERDDVRVIVPAEKAFRYGYGGKLAKLSIPYMDFAAEDSTLDISRSTRIPQAMDFFFDLPACQRRWIAALDAGGYGLVQASTAALRGRKLFVWGNGTGGRNWQTFLSQPGQAYLEIQAGLARTQLEHLPMKGRQSIEWLEAYGAIEADPAMVHGHDWQQAVTAVESRLDILCPQSRLDEKLKDFSQELNGLQGDLIQTAEGWARVEQELLGSQFQPGGLQFPEDRLGSAEKAWLQLVRDHALPCPEPLQAPASYQIGPEWEKRLAASIDSGGSRHWYGYYQYAVILLHAGKIEAATGALEQSIACTPNPWALRCQAVIHKMNHDLNQAAILLEQASAMRPERSLLRETLAVQVAAGRYLEAISLYDRLAAKQQQDGRLQVLLVEALIGCGQTERADQLLSGRIVLSDVREGEVSLTDLWFQLRAIEAGGHGLPGDPVLEQVRQTCRPPKHLDFRMHDH